MKASAKFVTYVPLPAIVIITIAAARPPWNATRVAGLALALTGLSLLTVARLQLGDAFSITPQARVLVTRGLYRRIRHPVYVFGAMAIAGVFLYLNRPKLLLLLLIVIPLQVLRARREEAVLEERFGEQYRAYRRATWF